MSSGAQVKTLIVPETTAGTTPASGTWQTLRFTQNTLTPAPNVQRSEEITSGRLSAGSITTSILPAGNIMGELSYGTYDDLLAALFWGSWSSDVLSVGSTRSTFSIQKSFADASLFHLFRGMHVATGSIEIPEDGKIMVSFGFQGMDYADAATKFDTGTPAAATTTPFMSSLSVGNIKVDDASIGACVSAMKLDIDNSVQIQRCLSSSSLGPGAIVATEAKITGSMTLEWNAASYAIWKSQIARTRFAVTYDITDSIGNMYSFDLPEVEFDGDLPSGGKTDIIQAQMNFTCVNSSPTITRTAFI